MKLSTKTLQCIKNFATINQGLVFKPGSKLRTVTQLRHIFAEVNIPDTFPTQFAVYDLNEFLSVFNLLRDPEIEFFDAYLTLSTENNTIKYYYSNPEVIVTPQDKDINFPVPDVELILTSDDIQKILKASAILKVNSIEFNQDGITLSNSTNASSNNFNIRKKMNSLDEKFKYSILVENMKMLTDLDYAVSITSKGLARFLSEDFGIGYYVGLNIE